MAKKGSKESMGGRAATSRLARQRIQQLLASREGVFAVHTCDKWVAPIFWFATSSHCATQKRLGQGTSSKRHMGGWIILYRKRGD